MLLYKRIGSGLLWCCLLLSIALFYAAPILAQTQKGAASLQLNTYTLFLPEGAGGELTVSVIAGGADLDALRWWSSNTAVADISDATGPSTHVLSRGQGQATITVTDPNSGASAACAVTVYSDDFVIAGSTLYRYRGIDSAVTIPAHLGITTVGEQAFYGNMGLQSVVLPNGIATVRSEAFAECGNLTSVTLPATVTSIASNAFYYAQKVTLYVSSGSYAERYAQTNGIAYRSSGGVAVQAVSLSPGFLSLSTGQVGQLTVTIFPSNATNRVVAWATGNAAVATVSSDGWVTAQGPGTTTVTVTTADGGKTATCAVTVAAATIPVSGISLDKTALPLKVGEAATLTAAVLPENATNRTVVWASDDPMVATVENGVVTGKAVGSTVVRAIALDGGYSATCAVTVAAATIPVSGISLDKTALPLKVGEAATLTAAVLPENATNRTVVWASDDPLVATVENGVVTGKAVGSTVVRAIALDGGYSATCAVTVAAATIPVSGISLDKTTLLLSAADMAQLTATVLPENATNKACVWTTSNAAIASVDDKGWVTGVAPGTAVVSVATVEGNHVASCAVTVTGVAVTQVLLDVRAMVLDEGGTGQLSAYIFPSNATDKTVTWTTSDPAVAAVSETGLVTATGPGNATVTVTTANGHCSDTCAVTVVGKNVPATGIVLDRETLGLVIGDVAVLSAQVLPENASNKTVAWTTSDAAVAAISSAGVVTAVGPGSCVLSAVAQDGGFVAHCAVKVEKAFVPVTGVLLESDTIDMHVGQTRPMVATVLPNNATNPAILWTSNAPDVLSVDDAGVVTAHRVGSALILATTVDGNKQAWCLVTAAPAIVAVTGITLDKAELQLRTGDTYQLTATVSPQDATDKTVAWSTSNGKVAAVSANGLVTAVGEGSAVLTAACAQGGLFATCTVQVTAIPTHPDFDVQDGVLVAYLGNTAQLQVPEELGIVAIGERAFAANLALSAVYLPEGVRSIGNLAFLGCANLRALRVPDSVATAEAIHTTALAGCSALTLCGGEGSATQAYAVARGIPFAPASGADIGIGGIQLSAQKLTVRQGESQKLLAAITPYVANVRALRWNSSDPAIATVDGDGLITGIVGGSVTITAAATWGDATASCDVTVLPVDYVVQQGTLTAYNGPGGQVNVPASLGIVAVGSRAFAGRTDITGVRLPEGVASIGVAAFSGCAQLEYAWLPDSATVIAGTAFNGCTEVVLCGSASSYTRTYAAAMQLPFAEVEGDRVYAGAVRLSTSRLALLPGGSAQLSARVLPGIVTNNQVRWQSADPGVARVDAQGRIAAIRPGNTTITALSADGHAFATCAVTVAREEYTIAPVVLSDVTPQWVADTLGLPGGEGVAAVELWRGDTRLWSTATPVGTGMVLRVLYQREDGVRDVLPIAVTVWGDAAGSGNYGDGQIDDRDVEALQNHILRQNALTGALFAAADVDHNGQLDMRDVALLRAYRMGKAAPRLG